MVPATSPAIATSFFDEAVYARPSTLMNGNRYGGRYAHNT
jgi:hypothetical protein